MNTPSEDLRRSFGDYPWTIIITNFACILFLIGIGLLCFHVSTTTEDRVLNTLTATLGTLIGWALGIFFAPYTKDEESRFSTIGQGISVFVSGYVVSKLDRFFESTMFAKSTVAGITTEIPSTISWIRLALFTCSALLIMLAVFTNRAYFHPKS